MATEQDQELWQKYLDAYSAYLLAGRNFVSGVSNKTEFLKSKIGNPVDRMAVFVILKWLPTEELKLFFSEILDFAITQNAVVAAAQELFERLPKDWVRENIEQYAEPILERNEGEEFLGMIYLYRSVDMELAKKLAERASRHENPEISDCGKFLLSRAT